MKILKENKAALRFLLVFIFLYVVLNTAYGFFIAWFKPNPDPFTNLIARQVAYIISFYDESVKSVPREDSMNVVISNRLGNVINVYEGCNGINVMIVFLAFLVAFRGPLKATAKYAFYGLLIIYLLNLVRVGSLYGVAIAFPQYLYFVHKYLLTGFLYMVVFYIWYRWIEYVRQFSTTRSV